LIGSEILSQITHIFMYRLSYWCSNYKKRL